MMKIRLCGVALPEVKWWTNLGLHTQSREQWFKRFPWLPPCLLLAYSPSLRVTCITQHVTQQSAGSTGRSHISYTTALVLCPEDHLAALLPCPNTPGLQTILSYPGIHSPPLLEFAHHQTHVLHRSQKSPTILKHFCYPASHPTRSSLQLLRIKVNSLHINMPGPHCTPTEPKRPGPACAFWSHSTTHLGSIALNQRQTFHSTDPMQTQCHNDHFHL